MTLLIVAALLTFALGWVWGHSTARIRVVPVGATAEQDAAVLKDWDDWLCCVAAFTSRGAEHDADHCTRRGQEA
jgi:hypothetical protein